MDIKLLDIENEKVVPSVECYTIPQLKKIMETYSKEEAIEILTYLYYMFMPKSAYINLEERIRQNEILEKFRTLDWSEEDDEVIEAEKLIKELYLSPTRRFYIDAKAGLEKLGTYLRTASVTDGKDGNFAALSVNYTRIGKMMEDFKKLEKLVEEEGKQEMRGGQELSYDQNNI